MTCRLSTWVSVIHFLFLIAPLRSQSINLSYSDLVTLNATCGDLDNCHGSRLSEDLRVVNCQCGSRCAQLGTCCVDSEYRTSPAPPSLEVAVKLYGTNETVFMVRECRGDVDEGVKDLCEIEDYEGYFDPFLLVPVSDMQTGIIYRNYYCFVCNEKDDNSGSPLLWDLKLYVESGGETLPPVESFPDIKYMWNQFFFENQFAHIAVEAPKEVYSQVNWFREDVISTCAEGWTDVTTKEKCGAYMALVYIRDEFRYQNPHCAICNYKNVPELVCSEPGGYSSLGGPLYGFQLVGSFSLEDEVNRCPKNEKFDKFAQTCRVVRCEKNKLLVEGECVNNPMNGESTERPVWSDNTISSGNRPQVPQDVFTWVTGINSTTERELPELPVTPLPTKGPVTTRNPDQPDDFQGTSETNAFTGDDFPELPKAPVVTESPITTPNPVSETSSFIGGDLPELPKTPLATESPITTPNSLSSHPDDFRFVTDPDPVRRGDRPELPVTPVPKGNSITTKKPQPDKPVDFQGTSKPDTFIDKDIPELPDSISPTVSRVTIRYPQSEEPKDFQWISDPNSSITKDPSKLPETLLPTQTPRTTRNPRPGNGNGMRGKPGPTPSTGRYRPQSSKTPLPTQSPIPTMPPVPQWFKPNDSQWTWDYNAVSTKKPSELPKTPLPAIRPTIIRNPSPSYEDGVKGSPMPSTGRFDPRPPTPDLRLDIHTFNQTHRPKGFVLFVFYDR